MSPLSPPPGGSGHRLAIGLSAVTAVALMLVATDALPVLRGAGSTVWTWHFQPRLPGLSSLPALALAALLVAVATSRLPERAAAAGRASRAALLAGIVLAGWGTGIALLAPEPGGALRTLIVRTIDPKFTSYHTAALTAMPEGAVAFVDRHRELLPTLPLHAATHPPGPALYYRIWLDAFAARPAAARAVARWVDLDDAPALAGLRPAQSPASIAAALVGALGLLLAGAAAAWPVARLVERLAGDAALGLRAAAIWPLVPGGALMAPEFDQALALPVAASAAALAASALAPGRRAALAAGALGGAFAATALAISYGAVAFLAGAALATVALGATSANWRRLAVGLGAAGLTGGALFSATALLGHEPLGAALDALALHGNRHTWRRPWGTSVALDLADTLLFLGPPLVALLAARLAAWNRSAGAAGLRGLDGPARWGSALVLAFALFLLSGTVRGEAGRIFVPWMPLLLGAAVAAPPRSAGGAGLDRAALTALAATLAVWTCALRHLLRVP
ncbi:MAG: hypothetical protein AMXMBFR36_30190 [Acidobacteriota bacterium]